MTADSDMRTAGTTQCRERSRVEWRRGEISNELKKENSELLFNIYCTTKINGAGRPDFTWTIFTVIK